MKLKTSLFKKGLVISNLKRFWWVSALYTIALLFAVPFAHYIQKFTYIQNNQISNENLEMLKHSIQSVLKFEGNPSQLFILVVPVIVAVLVFRFMQQGRSASLYHSLPMTRAALYLTSVLSALILFVGPLLITTIVMLLLNCFSYLSAYYTVKLIFVWLLYSLLFGIMFMSMGIFVGMFTGSSIAQLAFVYILNFLPMFLVECVRINVKGLLFGFDTYSNVNYYHKMPMSMIFRIGYEDSTTVLIIVYIFVTIALLVGGLFAFKLRKPETAGDIITFRPVKPIFIYGVVACATLLGGAYLMQIGTYSFGFAILGYFVSSLISYVVVQMIINKSFRILHTYKGYIGFALILVFLAFGIKFDVLGYVNKIPNANDVEEVYIGYDLNWWDNNSNPNFDKIYNVFGGTNIYKYPQNIQNITNLHKLILDTRSDNGNDNYIAYKLKNGKKIIRRYSIDTDRYASVLTPIYESKEYKEGRYPILYQGVNDIKYIEINDNRTSDTPFVLSDKAKLEGLRVAIRKDIDNLSYQELISNYQTALNINIVDIKDRSITYAVGSSYSNTIDWLKKEGIYEQIVIKPESIIDSVVLTSIYDEIDKSDNSSPASQLKTVNITNKAIIKELLDLSIITDTYNGPFDYSVTFTKGSNSHLYDFPMSFNAKVSPELQSYVDKIK